MVVGGHWWQVPDYIRIAIICNITCDIMHTVLNRNTIQCILYAVDEMLENKLVKRILSQPKYWLTPRELSHRSQGQHGQLANF